MAAPFPPTGEQQLYTERPLKVYGEQYLDGQPAPIGVVVGPGGPPDFTEAARVVLPTGAAVVALTDWVITNRYTGQAADVISNDEFSERFGGGPPTITGDR